MTEKKRALPPTARSVAARVLDRVLSDGAYAAAALDAELSRNVQLDARERGLATELTYGVLRTRRALEARLERHAPKGIKDFSTRLQLILAAYQMLVLDRIPHFAAVDAAVSAVRAQRGPRVAGFANAVLRKLGSEGEHLSLEQALRESAPSWLFERLCRVVGEAEALAVLGASDASPTVAIRLARGRELPPSLRSAEPGRLSPLAFRLERQGDPHALEGYAAGDFVVQEEGAQAVGLLLGARAGERVLDACAGRGQKASLLAEQVGSSGHVVATDLHPQKLEALTREFGRLGLPRPECRALDWTVGTAALTDDFDRVLVDAPCSGTGTLRHRPEILERLGPDDPVRLGELAAKILRAAATRAKPGGRVVFAVCSLLEEEAEAVVERVADVLTPCPFDAPELASLLGEGTKSLRLLPLRHGSDGYFVASFLRRG
jgi:16S rRNA (cytosine967-C5)-methyltransferase